MVLIASLFYQRHRFAYHSKAGSALSSSVVAP
jgi:hypothetical protein